MIVVGSFSDAMIRRRAPWYFAPMRREEVAGAADQSWTPPLDFDGFRVVRPLGGGGMGHVYVGRDDALDRFVALKFLAAADVKPAARERFLVEARAIARLQHPNIVGIYRVGEVAGRPYIAYELVAGKSLDHLPKPVPWQTALELSLGVARGLSAAHRHDVLHRDIKPANVMLADSGEIKLLDFGLAKLLDGAPERGALASERGALASERPPAMSQPALVTQEMGARLDQTMASARPNVALDATAYAGETAVRAALGTTSLTVTGAILGTPLYMAPELWRGEAATAQSDVYALGLLLYELLAGRLPFEGLRAAELAEAVQNHPPPPIRSLCPALPQALADVVDRCIRPLRDERFQTAEEAREALEAIHSLYQPFADPIDLLAAGSDDDAQHLTASFARIAPQADAFCAGMYERLFAGHPHLRPLFPVDMSAQQRKLFGALQVAVDHLRRPDRLVALLEDLGFRHVAYGVKPEHFDAVGEALLGAIATFDPLFDAATQARWTRAYRMIATAMIRGLLGERPLTAPTSFLPPPVELSPPRPRYARNGDINLAYQVLGSGPLDLVIARGWLTHLEVAWEWPAYVRALGALATLGRVIVYDGRGTGLSDSVGTDRPTLLEEQVTDLRAVMDAAGAPRAVLLGVSAGAAMAVLFAATHPERTRALVLYGGSARATTGDGHRHGVDSAAYAQAYETMRASWGEPLFLDQLAPSRLGDETFCKWWARLLRSAAGPGAAIALMRAGAATDVRAVLKAVQAPTLVLHRTRDLAVPIEQGRYLAQHIKGARLIELSGTDHLLFASDDDELFGEARRFVRDVTKAG